MLQKFLLNLVTNLIGMIPDKVIKPLNKKFIAWNTKRKREKSNKKKLEKHKNAKIKADHNSSFNDLP